MRISRRRLLASAAATALSIIGTPVFARAADPVPDDEARQLNDFLDLSSSLTGIKKSILAPSVDPLDIKTVQFRQVKADPAFHDLLELFRKTKSGDEKDFEQKAAAEAILSHLNTRYLARSIILAWYLGTWYPPSELKKAEEGKNAGVRPIPQKVLTREAYTQGLIWRVAEAHSMGYSELQFGYWAAPPPDRARLAQFLTEEFGK